MDEDKDESPKPEVESASNPEERAFTGHPDHPPATPDQSVEGNEELLRRPEDEEAEK